MAKTAFKIKHNINFTITEDNKFINVNFVFSYKNDAKLQSLEELKTIMQEEGVNEIEASGTYSDSKGSYNIQSIKLESGKIKFVHSKENNNPTSSKIRLLSTTSNKVSFNAEPEVINDAVIVPYIDANQFCLFVKLVKKCLFKTSQIIEKNKEFILKPNECCVVINLEDNEDTTIEVNGENYDMTDLVENNTEADKKYLVNKKCSVLHLR